MWHNINPVKSNQLLLCKCYEKLEEQDAYQGMFSRLQYISCVIMIISFIPHCGMNTNTNLISSTTPSGTLKIACLALRMVWDFVFYFSPFWCTSLSHYQFLPTITGTYPFYILMSYYFYIQPVASVVNVVPQNGGSN